MTGSLLQVALSGMRAAQVGLNNTSHNIANVNTPGYSRQTLSQAALPAVFFGGGYAGSGVSVTMVTRSYDALLTGQLRAAESQSARASSYAENIARLNAIVGESSGGITGAISNFFASMQGLTTNPGDPAGRQAVVANAQAVVQRFRDVGGNLQQQRDAINSQAEHIVTDVNARARAIAELSERVVAASARGQPPNDLLDQRDAMLSDLNKLVRISVTTQENGSINVYLGNGQALINGMTVQTLAMTANPNVENAPVLGVRSGDTVLPVAGNGDIGGTLGGLLAARDEALTAVEAAVGRLARVFTETINARNHLGLDLQGNAGGDIFAMDAPAAVAGTRNTGSASFTAVVADTRSLMPSDYMVEVTASGYAVTRLSDNQKQTFAGAPITLDGLELSISGAADVGDRFTIRAASNAVSSLRVALTDASRIATASPLRVDAAASNNGTGVASITINSDDPARHDSAQLVFDGAGQVTVTTVAGSTVMAYTPGSPLSINGWSVTLRGTPAAGDTFQVGPNTTVHGDNRNALALAALETQAVLPGMSFSGAYASMVVDIGTQGREADAARAANDGLAMSVRNARGAIAGVNLDEEAMNLMRYQQAYQAAGRMIGVANTLFDTILSLS